MDDRTAVVRSLVEWAEARSAVRAALLVGSRATPHARLDPFSDYDVVLFVRDRGRDDRRLLERTYAGVEPAENWDALFAATELFARAARGVAEALGFTGRGALGRKVEPFLRRIRARASEETGDASRGG